MKVLLKHLTYLSDSELLKIILSSADRFPGLYRFSSSWKRELERENYLKFLPFLEICYRAEQNVTWSKSQWLSSHSKIYDLAFGVTGRDSDRSDREVGGLLRRKGQEWIDKANSLSLVVIDTDFQVEEIVPETTYYMMGSLIRFKENSVEISYDHFKKVSHTSLKVPFQEVKNYIESTFSINSLRDLFFKAEIIAYLNFNDKEEGELLFHSHELNDFLMNFNGNAPIFAAINYDDILPIRFAKLIGVSNVCV